MKKNKRIGMLVDEFSSNPGKLFDSRHFCEKFDIAKSSLSEDLRVVNELLMERGSGHIESTSGVGGGICYVPGIGKDGINELQKRLITSLSESSRSLGGGYLYTSDVMFDSDNVRDMARVFAQEFHKLHADYVVTVETKGIPLASEVAKLLNIPLVVIRREAKYSEGSTVSINYFSGSSDRIQKMSISKRAVEPDTTAIIIDDFMRGGGSLKGLEEILAECGVTTVGMGVAMVSREPVRKRVENYVPIVYLEHVDDDEKKIVITPNEAL